MANKTKLQGWARCQQTRDDYMIYTRQIVRMYI